MAIKGASSPAVWKMAEDIWTPSVPGDALRYLDDPARDGRSNDWYPSRLPPASSCNSNNDFGGVCT
jgi:vibriolysin